MVRDPDRRELDAKRHNPATRQPTPRTHVTPARLPAPPSPECPSRRRGQGLSPGLCPVQPPARPCAQSSHKPPRRRVQRVHTFCFPSDNKIAQQGFPPDFPPFSGSHRKQRDLRSWVEACNQQQGAQPRTKLHVWQDLQKSTSRRFYSASGDFRRPASGVVVLPPAMFGILSGVFIVLSAMFGVAWCTRETKIGDVETPTEHAYA